VKGRRARSASVGHHIRIGAFSNPVYERHLAALLQRSDQEESPEALLRFAERLLDRIEAQATPRPPALTILAHTAEALLITAEDAEDEGYAEANLVASSHGQRLLFWQERFLVAALSYSHLLLPLLEADPGAPAHEPGTWIQIPRPLLQYWLLALEAPTFPAARSISNTLYHQWLERVEHKPLMGLLAGRWEELPPFRPERILSLGGVADLSAESAPLGDWTLRSPQWVATANDQLLACLARALHLAYLEAHAPTAYADFIGAHDLMLTQDADGRDELLGDFGRIAAQRLWPQAFLDVWDYVSGASDRVPEQLPFPRMPAAAECHQEALRVLEVYRTLARFLATAKARNDGLYALML